MEDFELTVIEAMALIVATTFRDFTKEDWRCFAGCESDNPKIGQNGKYLIVSDGEIFNIIHEEADYGGQTFELNKL